MFNLLKRKSANGSIWTSLGERMSDLEVIADAIQELDDLTQKRLCQILFKRDEIFLKKFTNTLQLETKSLSEINKFNKAKFIVRNFNSNLDFSSGAQLHKIQKKFDHFIATTMCRPGLKQSASIENLFEEKNSFYRMCNECETIEE